MKIEYRKDGNVLFPEHDMVDNWVFKENEELECYLCESVAAVAEKNGLTANDLQHIYPVILRILKSNIDWAN